MRRDSRCFSDEPGCRGQPLDTDRRPVPHRLRTVLNQSKVENSLTSSLLFSDREVKNLSPQLSSGGFMNDNENRKHQMFVRAHQFLASRASDFAPSSLVKQLVVDLEAVVTDLDNHTAAQASGGSTARQGTVTRAEARAALREDLEAINRT